LFQFQIQQLRHELAAAQMKIISLSSHLNTNVIITNNYPCFVSVLISSLCTASVKCWPLHHISICICRICVAQ